MIRLRFLRPAFVFVMFAMSWLPGAAAPAFAQIQFNVLHPAGGNYGEPVEIAAYVVSPTEVLSVVATAGGRSVPLVYVPWWNQWTGSLSLDGLPRGPYTMVIEASNAGGETAQVSRQFTYDKPPILRVVQPANNHIGPDIPIEVECIDDGPTCDIEVDVIGGTRVFGNITIDTVLSLPDRRYGLWIKATDSLGLRAEVVRQVFVSSDSRLSVADTFQGAILDIDADRALTFDDTVTPNVVRLYDRAAETNQIIWTAANTGQVVQEGFLTPNNGALFEMTTPDEIYDPLLEWRGGVLTQVGNMSGDLVVKGAWAAFNGYIPPCCPGTGLVLRDLTAGTNILVAPNAYVGRGGLAPDGRVVFMSTSAPYEILEFNPNPPPGTTTQLTASAPLSSFQPITDGINVVFRRTEGDSQYSIVLRTQAGDEEVLATDLTTEPLPGSGYQVAGGWTAFVRDGGIWLRKPDGTLRQVSPRGFIEALDANGDLVFATYISLGVKSYSTRSLAKADGTVRELGEVIATVKFIDGAPVVVGGDRLLDLPTPPTRAILAEGATGTFFSTDVAILNPAATPVPVTVRYFREGQPEISQPRTLPARSRTTIHLDDVPGLEGASVSTQVDGLPGAPLVVERLMSWDATGYGGHLGTAVDAPRRQWYFAEGAQGFFSTFFLIANSGTEEATVTFRFLVELGTPVTHTMSVPPAARRTFHAGDLPDLVNRSFATIIETDVPVVAERAMYFGDAPFWLGGHGSAGVGLPDYDWFHAEGATGSLFDTFILLANPHYYDADVTMTFTTDSGVTVTRHKRVPANGRLTVNIEEESPELASANVSTRVHSSNYPIVSERAMYWGTTGAGWREAHNSFGVTSFGPKWGLAEGRAGGDRDYQTYVLVSNATEDDADLEVTFIREDGTIVEKTYTAKAGERLNIHASALTELADSNFSTIVESINDVVINVESAIYWNAGGVVWESGGNTVATRIP